MSDERECYCYSLQCDICAPDPTSVLSAADKALAAADKLADDVWRLLGALEASRFDDGLRQRARSLTLTVRSAYEAFTIARQRR